MLTKQSIINGIADGKYDLGIYTCCGQDGIALYEGDRRVEALVQESWHVEQDGELYYADPEDDHWYYNVLNNSNELSKQARAYLIEMLEENEEAVIARLVNKDEEAEPLATIVALIKADAQKVTA